MKLAIILLFAFSALVHAQKVTLGTRVQRRTYTCVAGDSGLRCDSCTGAVVCNGIINLGPAKCETPNSYCDAATHTCTNVKPATCTAAASNFKCPQEGFFPDIENCQFYYFCASSTATAETWTCPANFVYDALNNNCKRLEDEEDCATIKCVTANTFIPHSVNANFYAYCDVNLLATLFQCPTNLKFNGGCKFECRAEGYFPGSTDVDYYHCAKSGRTWVVSTGKCPTGYTFSAISKNCVKSVV